MRHLQPSTTRRPTEARVEPRLLEVVVEECRESWASALVHALVPHGDVYVRFVARERVAGRRPSRQVLAGAPFPAARAGLDDLRAQGAWLQIQRARLREIEAALAEAGWEPAGAGEHWWSVRFTRPALGFAAAEEPMRRQRRKAS